MAFRKTLLSFQHALQGIWIAFKEERHLKFHFLATLLVIGVGSLVNLSTFEWIVIMLLITLVITLELFNTAIETIVDSFTQDTHPGAKKAKDISAGAVLISSLLAALIGLIIFLPKFGQI